MKRYLPLSVFALLLLIPLLASSQGVVRVQTPTATATPTPTPFTACFDFRSTSGFVSDPSPCTYVLKTDTYPTTRGTFTFGWVLNNNSVNDADRNAANIPQLAGINFTSGFGGSPILLQTYFQVDLPSATNYTVHLAVGDTSGQVGQRVEIRDGIISLSFVVSAASTAANHYLDATGADLTNASWAGSEVGVTKAFAGTVLRMYCGDLATSDTTTVAYLGIVQ